jgi:putative membrane protein
MKKRRGVMLMMMVPALMSMAILSCNNDDDNDNNQLSAVDDNFVQKASQANMTEVSFGQVAASRASDSSVRAFAQQMVSEHTTANAELKQIGNSYSNVAWTDSIDDQHQALMNQLMSLSGSQFDSAYIKSQVMDHQTTNTLFDTEIKSGSTQRVVDYAKKYQPHIQEHLQMADSLQNTLSQDSTNQR